MSSVNPATPATRFESLPDLDLKFPPLPRTVSEVSLLLAEQAEAPDTPRLVEIVDADPVVAAAVLRRINSAYYGLRRPVGDVRRATFLLGFEEVCNIVMTSGMLQLREVIAADEQATIFDLLMRQSVGAAYFTHFISQQLGLPNQRVAYTMGLLHTVGRLALLYNRPDDYEALWWTNDAGGFPSAASERSIFGVDHASLGAIACKHWNLPEEVVEVIRYHLTPALQEVPGFLPVTRALNLGVHVAEQVVRQGGDGTGTYVVRIDLQPLLRAARPVDDTVPTAESLLALLDDQRAPVRAYIDAMASTR